MSVQPRFDRSNDTALHSAAQVCFYRSLDSLLIPRVKPRFCDFPNVVHSVRGRIRPRLMNCKGADALPDKLPKERNWPLTTPARWPCLHQSAPVEPKNSAKRVFDGCRCLSRRSATGWNFHHHGCGLRDMGYAISLLPNALRSIRARDGPGIAPGDGVIKSISWMGRA